MSANKDVANQNLMAWDYNKNIPFQQNWNRFSNMTNSGTQNAFSGLQGLGADALLFSSGNNGGGNSGGSMTDNTSSTAGDDWMNYWLQSY